MSADQITSMLRAMEDADTSLRIVRVMTPDAGRLPESLSLRFACAAVVHGDALEIETADGEVIPVE